MKSMTWALALISIAATGGLATAQPLDPVPPPPEPVVPPPEPPRPPEPPVNNNPPNTTPTTDTASTGRPEGTSVGIGLGYLLPTSLETPNITSVRVRLASGLTFEPQVTLARTAVTRDMGVMGMPDEKDSATELTLATVARLPLVRHGKVELELLGSVGLTTTTDNPDGIDNNTKATAIALGWGVGVTYWYSRHFCLSLSAGNPLVSFTKTTREQPTPLDDTSTTTTAIGAIFDPTVAIMIHLFN